MTSPRRLEGFIAAAALALLIAACTEDAPRWADVKPGALAETKAPGPIADPNKALVDRVRQALARERQIEADDIDVSASGGVVSLWGTVADAKQRQRAAEVAGAVAGVQSVENKLTVAKGS